MHRCQKWLLITVFTLMQFVFGSRVVLAHDALLNHQHGDSGLLLAQYQVDRQPQLPAYGQEGGIRIDVDPPLIEHDVIAESEADIRQTFVATVVDDEELDSVLFYYRYAGETTYSRYMMMQVSFSSTYIAQIPTDPNSFKPIQYYIQARDTSGNRTVRGYAFSPLVRNIISPVAFVENPPAWVKTTSGTPEQTATRHVPKIVYIVGGALLLGLIASAVSSGGSNDDGGDACEPDGCRLTLTVNRPF